MPRNGSGVFSPPAANYPAVSGTLIESADRNAIDADIATAITNSIAVNGESVVTNNIPFGGNKLTGVAPATVRTDVMTLANVQDGTGVYVATVGGTADVITISPNPSIPAYAAGQEFSFIAGGANTTNVTLNVSGLGAKAVTKNGSTALAAGDIPSGFLVTVKYDGTRFQLVGSKDNAFGGGTFTGDITMSASSIITAEGADVASATTTNIWATDGNTRHITGNTTITSFGTAPQAGAVMRLIFDGTPLLTHSTNLNLNAGTRNIQIEAGDYADVYADTTTQFDVIVTRKSGEPISGIITDKIQPITASVAANTLTLTLNPTTLDFRSATLTSGAVNTRSILSAISMTVSSGSTLGTISTVQSRIAVLAIDNAGTVEVACVNVAGGFDLTETGLISTTAEGGGGGADSLNVVYSTTARTNVPYRVVGYVESTQATAGTWATAPSTIQGAGGNSVAAMTSLGYGQTWQSFTVGVSRVLGTTYYNTTARPIFIKISQASVTGTQIIVDGVNTGLSGGTATSNTINVAIVPPGSSYSVTGAASTWTELR